MWYSIGVPAFKAIRFKTLREVRPGGSACHGNIWIVWQEFCTADVSSRLLSPTTSHLSRFPSVRINRLLVPLRERGIHHGNGYVNELM